MTGSAIDYAATTTILAKYLVDGVSSEALLTKKMFLMDLTEV